jgi:hypothetical protein
MAAVLGSGGGDGSVEAGDGDGFAGHVPADRRAVGEHVGEECPQTGAGEPGGSADHVEGGNERHDDGDHRRGHQRGDRWCVVATSVVVVTRRLLPVEVGHVDLDVQRGRGGEERDHQVSSLRGVDLNGGRR